jgi:hypothetical protein
MIDVLSPFWFSSVTKLSSENKRGIKKVVREYFAASVIAWLSIFFRFLFRQNVEPSGLLFLKSCLTDVTLFMLTFNNWCSLLFLVLVYQSLVFIFITLSISSVAWLTIQRQKNSILTENRMKINLSKFRKIKVVAKHF